MAISALVVDDSRVALVALARMLRAYGFHVDTAESGPETMDYLRANLPPAVIFLDHMMPGMDGFETLSLLKRDPSTTMIPIVMYTSREGDAYMGQARALGAAAVLHKPINPLELSGILTRLSLVPDRVAATPSATVVALRAGAGSATSQRPAHGPTSMTPSTPPERAVVANDADWRSRVQPTQPPLSAPPAEPRRRGAWLLPALYGLVLLLAAMWLWHQHQVAGQLRAELAEQRNALAERQRASDLADTRLQLVQATMEAQRRAPATPAGWIDALVWAVNQHGHYEHDQIALSDERLLMVRELLARLGGMGFQGTVRLETHIGEFCLVRDGDGAYRLPAIQAQMSSCEIVRYSAEQASTLAHRQSPAFSRFIAERSGPRVPIHLALVAHGKAQPLLPYPDPTTVQTAGEWNQIARLNQRVEISLEPAR